MTGPHVSWGPGLSLTWGDTFKFRTLTASRSFRQGLKPLENRLVPAGLRNALFAVLNQPLQAAVTRMHQPQSNLTTDIATLQTDADSFTFFTESMAVQTKLDQDYAHLMLDVAQIHALDVQIHNEATNVILIVALGGGFRIKALTRQAIMTAISLQADADNVHNAVFSAAPVTASPIAGLSLAPQYPAFSSIPRFPG
jgi:hypothetical protein